MKPEPLCCLPSQTVGPFFHIAFANDPASGRLAGSETASERISVRVRLLDGDGVPVEDGLIELWQADAEGNYPRAPGDAFRGFGQLPTGAEGACIFETIYPGRVSCGDAFQAPHISVSVFARGLLGRLCTRIYFEGDPSLAEDPILRLVPEERRRTLLAQRDPVHSGRWNFDIRLQGEQETVFFDV